LSPNLINVDREIGREGGEGKKKEKGEKKRKKHVASNPGQGPGLEFKSGLPRWLIRRLLPFSAEGKGREGPIKKKRGGKRRGKKRRTTEIFQ